MAVHDPEKEERSGNTRPRNFTLFAVLTLPPPRITHMNKDRGAAETTDRAGLNENRL